MKTKKLQVKTSHRNEMIDVTRELSDFVHQSGVENGTLQLFVPHTTAAVTINENADPTVQSDMLHSLEKISPVLREFRHMEGNSDAHVKSSLIGCSMSVLIEDSSLVLGVWQGIYFCEFDGPRNRSLIARVVSC